ncbi:MAG: hypothetical protein IE914_04550 [Thiotrichales bacterium]|nr:hypothetical protein [Thiotrichales bacterium]
MDEMKTLRRADVMPNNMSDRITNLANQSASGAADVFVGAGYAMRRTWKSPLWAFGFVCTIVGIPPVAAWMWTTSTNFGKGIAAGISHLPAEQLAHESAWVQTGATLGSLGRGVVTGAGQLIVTTSESVSATLISDPGHHESPTLIRRTYRPNQNLETIPIVVRNR